ncbi:DUF1622 domain-containing protein [Methanolobus sp. ZRKC2]|uniref:DUF1622 domain-containing protein n=1 Tax=Methanolobus sp. ZRKC2 TaxID=3125783 RepID=UPI00324FEA09
MVGMENFAGLSQTVLIIFQVFLTAVGMFLIIYGGVLAAVEIFIHEFRKKKYPYTHIRHQFTDKILFGLEFLIAADVILSVMNPSISDLLSLSVLVIVRTILGYFLSKEVEEYQFEE